MSPRDKVWQTPATRVSISVQPYTMHFTINYLFTYSNKAQGILVLIELLIRAWLREDLSCNNQNPILYPKLFRAHNYTPIFPRASIYRTAVPITSRRNARFRKSFFFYLSFFHCKEVWCWVFLFVARSLQPALTRVNCCDGAPDCNGELFTLLICSHLWSLIVLFHLCSCSFFLVWCAM